MDIVKICREVVAGKKIGFNDTQGEAAARHKLVQQVAEITAKGGIVEFPAEIPGDETPDLKY